MKIYWRTREGNAPPPDAVFLSAGLKLENVNRVEALPEPTRPISVLSKSLLPDKQGWTACINQTLGGIQNGLFQKVVLARCCTLECAEEPNPWAIAAALGERAKNATVFCLRFDDGSAFLGATPERLFTRQGRGVIAEAVAGTKNRDAPERDLLTSDKDRREVDFVQTYIYAKLLPFCDEVVVSPTSVHATHNVKHLYSQIRGTLKTVCDEKLLAALHPTPALCGTPTEAARAWIAAHEPFSRGHYGGTFGWQTADAAEHVVAIRCCEIRGCTVRLYTGAGIVAGSDPEAEWNELDAKMALYDGIFQ